MYRSFIIVLVVLLITSSFAKGGEKIPFTHEGFTSLVGQDICNLEGEFDYQLGVNLDKRNEYAVQYRERNSVIAVFLLSRPTLDCGVVNAYLDVTSLIKTGESVEFKCYTDHEGGTTWGKWGHVIGLANNQGGTKRFVRARLAWRVNVKEKRFERIEGKKVGCDTTGYAD